MLDAFSVPPNRLKTALLLIIGSALVLAALLAGIDDNWPGVALAYLAAIAFVLSLTHPWREPKQYLRLAYTSVGGFVVFVLIHNLFDAIASNLDGWAHDLIGGVSATSFIIATLLCPAGLVVGGVGFTVSFWRRRHSRSGMSAA